MNPMSSLDFQHYSIGLGFLVLVGFLSYMLYHLTQTIRTLKTILEETEDITKDVSRLKNSIKFGIFNILSSFMKKRR